MKNIFTSKWHGDGESIERVHVYAFDNSDEFWEFESMTHKERCDCFNVFDEFGYSVMPGAVYYTYDFFNTTKHVVMCETKAMNV